MSDRWTKYSALAEILSSIAVLITLLFLVVQMRQNTEAINAQLGSNRVAARAAVFELAFKAVDYRMASPRIGVNLYSNEALSLEEERELDGYIITFWAAREFVWFQYQDGSLDQSTFDTMMADVSYLAIPRMQKWWDERAEAVFDPDFVAYINSRSEKYRGAFDE